MLRAVVGLAWAVGTTALGGVAMIFRGFGRKLFVLIGAIVSSQAGYLLLKRLLVWASRSKVQHEVSPNSLLAYEAEAVGFPFVLFAGSNKCPIKSEAPKDLDYTYIFPKNKKIICDRLRLIFHCCHLSMNSTIYAQVCHWTS